ncbi:hypothetical protein LTR78_002886 [Recurvomyces mirabilis]|uniref:F-box domain-containing protein n=1 Tax=Recurvomyces mirabilis TaxID=574656 RepID=A0AAE1C4C7_9PEZI|nr:hypothetical protein LTR78_002886 [Recurvomyces mirabilis]KAK5159380.1 hypothetical protein LTS14_002522 [Recurvomyces mirabilis]
MATMLDLPRELYLGICALLSAHHLANLSGVTKDHYLAAQQPLYNHIQLTSYKKLVRLTETLSKNPVVSTISPQQRLRWFKLSEEQLLERNIKTIALILDRAKDGHKITGAVVANCLGAISRKCYSVKISLTLHGGWPGWQKQLERFGMSNVTELTLFIGSESKNDQGTDTEAGARLWDLVFSGSCFSDLKRVYINTAVDDLDGLPEDLLHSVGRAYPVSASLDWEPIVKPSKDTAVLFGLRKMEAITLAHTTRLTVDTMTSLFASDLIPTRLTKLEIVDCPNLHPVRHLSAICTLLQRALQLVKHLKLHLCRLPSHEAGLDGQYGARIQEHPEEHPCTIIRELGKTIPHLDIAMPFVCTEILPLASKMSARRIRHRDTEMELPAVPFEPYDTLPERLVEAEYKYRRVICWKDVCGYGYPWRNLVEVVEGMGVEDERSKTSWEFLHKYEMMGVWKVDGCLPVELVNQEILERPFVTGGT